MRWNPLPGNARRLKSGQAGKKKNAGEAYDLPRVPDPASALYRRLRALAFGFALGFGAAFFFLAITFACALAAALATGCTAFRWRASASTYFQNNLTWL